MKQFQLLGPRQGASALESGGGLCANNTNHDLSLSRDWVFSRQINHTKSRCIANMQRKRACAKKADTSCDHTLRAEHGRDP